MASLREVGLHGLPSSSVMWAVWWNRLFAWLAASNEHFECVIFGQKSRKKPPPRHPAKAAPDHGLEQEALFHRPVKKSFD